MTIIIGIDPGSRITGYGVIQKQGNAFSYLDSGCIRVKGDSLSEKIAEIYTGVATLVAQHQPMHAAVEQVFFGKNASSALKLGQARGAALAAIAVAAIPIGEYAPRKVKQAIVGTGAAEKSQIGHMVKCLLKLPGTPQEDAADALAIALCHGFHLSAAISTQVKAKCKSKESR